LPPIIPERIITISGYRRGLIVDPFAGSGSTVIAAIASGMKFIAVDCEAEYCALMIKRVSEYSSIKGEL